MAKQHENPKQSPPQRPSTPPPSRPTPTPTPPSRPTPGERSEELEKGIGRPPRR